MIFANTIVAVGVSSDSFTYFIMFTARGGGVCFDIPATSYPQRPLIRAIFAPICVLPLRLPSVVLPPLGACAPHSAARSASRCDGHGALARSGLCNALADRVGRLEPRSPARWSPGPRQLAFRRRLPSNSGCSCQCCIKKTPAQALRCLFH